MTQDEIIELWNKSNQHIYVFAKLVAAKEREACAKLCETLWTEPDNGMSTEEQCYGDKCADAIRARGEA